MYDKILPALKSMLSALNINDKIFANAISVNELHGAILFEDLSPKGYCVRTTKDGFNLSQTKMILSKLARFHGLAAKLQEQEPNVFKNFQHGEI